jgi:hypothetical protein
MIDESKVTPRIATSVRVCADHETCERNKRAAFRKPQTCLTCERREATHFIADDSAYMLRCDECLVSNFGCPHAAPNVCPDCYDALTLDIYDGSEGASSATNVDVDALVAEIAADISLYHDDGDYGTCAINYCTVCGKYWGNCKQDGHERTAKPCNCSVSRDIAIMTDKLRKALGEP